MEGKIKEFYRPSNSDVIWNSPEGEVEQGNTSWPEFIPRVGLIRPGRLITSVMVVTFLLELEALGQMQQHCESN